MKTFSKLLYLFSFVAILLSCNKKSLSVEDGDISIELDKRYIQFNSAVPTRGSLITGEYLEDDFAVLGYQYRGNWQTASIMAKPNVFFTSEGDLALPQIVTHNNGIFTYSPLQAWTGNTYSFFGYYPSEHDNIELFDPESNKEGVPYITYTVPNASDPRGLIDIMTASYIDTNVDYSYDVHMNMRHRLSAIDIGVRNYYQYIDAEEIPHLITIEITSLELQLTTYEKAKIYLDYTTPTSGSGAQTLTYKMVGLGEDWSPSIFEVKSNSNENTSLTMITKYQGENATSILLVPQSNHIEGTLKMEYKKRFEDGTGYMVNEEPISGKDQYTFELSQNLKDFNRSLVEGRRYFIEITFTSDAVSVNIVAADEWDELEDDVKHEFE